MISPPILALNSEPSPERFRPHHQAARNPSILMSISSVETYLMGNRCNKFAIINRQLVRTIMYPTYLLSPAPKVQTDHSVGSLDDHQHSRIKNPPQASSCGVVQATQVTVGGCRRRTYHSFIRTFSGDVECWAGLTPRRLASKYGNYALLAIVHAFEIVG